MSVPASGLASASSSSMFSRKRPETDSGLDTSEDVGVPTKLARGGAFNPFAVPPSAPGDGGSSKDSYPFARTAADKGVGAVFMSSILDEKEEKEDEKEDDDEGGDDDDDQAEEEEWDADPELRRNCVELCLRSLNWNAEKQGDEVGGQATPVWEKIKDKMARLCSRWWSIVRPL